MSSENSESVTETELQTALRVERSKWIEPDYPEIATKPDIISEFEQQRDLDVPNAVLSSAAINTGWCRVFAERVFERLDCPENITIESDGSTHTWIRFEGGCYDAECLDGVDHPSRLPVYTTI